MKSVIDRYGKSKDEQQAVANPNSELKVWFPRLILTIYTV